MSSISPELRQAISNEIVALIAKHYPPKEVPAVVVIWAAPGEDGANWSTNMRDQSIIKLLADVTVAAAISMPKMPSDLLPP